MVYSLLWVMQNLCHQPWGPWPSTATLLGHRGPWHDKPEELRWDLGFEGSGFGA